MNIRFLYILYQCEHAMLSITYRSEKMYFEYHQIVLQSINSLLLHFGVNKFKNKMTIFWLSKVVINIYKTILNDS